MERFRRCFVAVVVEIGVEGHVLVRCMFFSLRSTMSLEIRARP